MPVDAQCKIKYLSGLAGGDQEPIPRQVFRHLWPSLPAPANPTQLAKAMDVKHNTLQGWYENMPAKRQDLLAEKYGFTPAIRQSWNKDDCAKFKRVYEEHWQPQLARRSLSKHRAQPSLVPSNVLLVKGPPMAPEPCKIRSLAAVELFPAQIGRGTADIGFEISCGVARMFGVPVTIRVGEVAWDCGGGQLDPSTRKGRAAPYRPEGGGVTLQWNGADTFKPAWRVKGDGTSLGNVDVPPDFGRVMGLAPGSTITITFGVWRPDIEEAEGADTNAVVAEFDAISVPLDAGNEVDPAALSIVKKRILARMATDALERQGDFIILCRHTVTFLASEPS